MERQCIRFQQSDAKNNWWGVTDDSTVQGKIYDWIDDSTKGTVNYYPYGTSTNTAAPFPSGQSNHHGSSDLITVNWSANSESIWQDILCTGIQIQAIHMPIQ